MIGNGNKKHSNGYDIHFNSKRKLSSASKKFIYPLQVKPYPPRNR